MADLFTATERRNRFYVAQLVAFMHRLESGGAALTPREKAWAFSADRAEELAQSITSAKALRKDLKSRYVEISDMNGRTYWRQAEAVHALQRGLGKEPAKVGKAYSEWLTRCETLRKENERADELWNEVDPAFHHLFDIPPPGGFGADRKVWCQMEWPLPVAKYELDVGHPELSDIPRAQQLETLMRLLDRLTVHRVDEASENTLKGRMSALTALAAG